MSVGDEVAAHVLRDNYEQNVMLAMTRYNGPSMVTVHARLLQALEDAGRLDRKLEALPTGRELAQREAVGEGLCSAEMAVVAAYAKIVLTEQIADSTVPDESWFQRVLAGYFPAAIVSRFAGDMAAHPLRHELITTCVVNDMVNRGGTTFVHRAMEETGADSAQVTRAYTISREVFGLEVLWADIEALDNEVPTAAQHSAYHEIRRLIDRATRWLIDVRFPITDVAGEIEHFAATVAELSPQIPHLLRGSERENLYAEVDRMVGLGLPRNLSVRISELLTAFLLLDVVEIAHSSGQPAHEVAQLHFAVSDRFSVDEMLTRISNLPRDDRQTWPPCRSRCASCAACRPERSAVRLAEPFDDGVRPVGDHRVDAEGEYELDVDRLVDRPHVDAVSARVGAGDELRFRAHQRQAGSGNADAHRQDAVAPSG